MADREKYLIGLTGLSHDTAKKFINLGIELLAIKSKLLRSGSTWNWNGFKWPHVAKKGTLQITYKEQFEILWTRSIFHDLEIVWFDLNERHTK